MHKIDEANLSPNTPICNNHKIHMNWMKTAFGGSDITGDSTNNACSEGQQLYRAVGGVALTQP